MYGVIDIGSNTIRMVIYKVENGQLKPMINKKAAVGLAGYVSKDNNLKKSGILQTVEVLNQFDEILQRMNIEEIFPFATASLRNINNSEEVLKCIKERTPFDVQIISGEQEALFDYYGALQNMNMDSGMMIDVGGGSTELVFYKNEKIIKAISLPIGSLNMREKYVSAIVPNQKEVAQIVKEVKKQLEMAKLPKFESICDDICAVGGTARAVYKVVSSKRVVTDASYDVNKLAELVDMAADEDEKLVEQILKIAPERIHTFIPGLLIIQTIAEEYKSKKVNTSYYGVREGYLHNVLKERGVING